MGHAECLVGLCVACACAAGCVEDKVYPGFYGESSRSDELAITGNAAGVSGMGDAPSTGAAGASAGVASSAGVGGVAGASVPPLAGTGAVAAGEGSSAAGGMDARAGADAPSDDPCDLSGRWLVTVHNVTDAIGQLQTNHLYQYYEIAKDGDGYAITKGMQCGHDAVAEGLFAIRADFRGAWAGIAARLNFAGRGVRSVPVAGGCDVRFDKFYTVLGASNPHYLDPSVPLPKADQPASGTTPGWEDWDEDGMPGITGMLSGTVTGKLFVAPRYWNEFGAVVPEVSALLKLPSQWDQEQNVMSYEGSPLLGSTSVRAANPALHFVELARLTESQATGDDAAICAAVPALAPMLTPTAAAL